jgi:hypothetical protein
MYAEAFGQYFVDGLAPHHIEAIEWHWNARIELLEGKFPKYDAYFPIWSRAHNKSGIARRVAVMDGILSYAYRQPAYILYISRNKDMVLKHAKSIETILQSSRIQRLCPQLAQEQINEQKRSKGWTAKFLYTAANVIFHFAGLDEGMAGGNLETSNAEEVDDKPSDVRVTLFVPDDIDGREDSPAISEGRFNTLTNEVLPMGQANTLTFFAQNLISRTSCMYRIWKQQSRVLTGRKRTEPVPAVINPVFETRNVDGIIQDVFISGDITWHVWDQRRVQAEVNRFGLEAFKRECLHLVDQAKEGLIIHTYHDEIHVISESELASIYGSKNAWKQWYKVPFNDWSRTKTEKHSNVAGYIAVSSQNTALPGMTVCIPLSFPADSMPEDVAERLLSVLTPHAYGENGSSVTWRSLIDQAHTRANADKHFDTSRQRQDFERSHVKAVIPKYSRPILKRFNVYAGAMSHSEDTVRTIFNEVFGFAFQPSNPHKLDCIEEMNGLFRINWDEDHPFRPVKGYTRTFILAPDDLTKEPRYVKGMEVYPPKPYPNAMQPHELHDSDLHRFQFVNWRYAEPVLTATGERVDEPLKINDDFGQAWQMVLLKRLLFNIPLSQDEREELNIPQVFRLQNVNQQFEQGNMTEEEYGRALITRQAKLTIPKVLANQGKKPLGRFARFKK